MQANRPFPRLATEVMGWLEFIKLLASFAATWLKLAATQNKG